MKGVHPSACTHHIYIKEDYKPVRQPQRRMNPALKDIFKEELQKLLDAGFIYPIFDSEWVSPLVLVPKKNDQGSQFTSNLIEDLLTYHRIKHRTSTPYHPQANGQVEVTNRALEGILTKVMSSRKEWADRLVEATWAYNTTWKTTTGFTPYELVYGKKALLLIEFEFNTLRMTAQLDLDLSHAQKERLL
eukprot:PITA_21802